MTKKALLIISVLYTIGIQLHAQFSLTGEIRPRGEYRHGFGSLIGTNEDPAMFISQRSRLNFDYKSSDVNIFISLQDVRVWGEVPQLNRTDMNSSIHEAWAEFPIKNVFSIKLGRQEIIYDNSRIFGNVDWAQQARSHDLALFKTEFPSGLKLHAGLAYNQEAERRTSTFYTLNNYKTMQYAWLNYKPANTGVSFLFMNLGFQSVEERDFYNQTIGAFATHSFGQTQLEGALYLQTGKDQIGNDLGAWYLGAEVKTPLSDHWTLRPGFEILTGTDMQGAEKNHSFNPWFGTNHRFNGHMDYFYVGNHINNVGLRDLYVAFDYRKEKWLAMAAVHNFWADGRVTVAGNPNESMPSYLGTELDLMLGYALNPTIALRLGYSQMFATQTMQRIKGGNKDEIQNWLWAMIIIKPKFL